MHSLQFRERRVCHMCDKTYGPIEFDSDVAAAITRANKHGTNYIFAFAVIRRAGPDKQVFRPNHQHQFAAVPACYLQLDIIELNTRLRILGAPAGDLRAEDILAPHEAGDKLAFRLAQQLIQSADLLQETLVQYGGTVRHGKCLFEIMAYVNGRQAKPALNIRKLRANLLPGDLVQGADGLIQKQNFWFQNQSPRQGDALFFAPAEAVDTSCQQMPDAQQVRGFGDVRFRVTVGAQAERDVPLDGKMRKKSVILRHVPDTAPARFEVGNIAPVEEDLSGLDFF